jgi:hypothetical protein
MKFKIGDDTDIALCVALKHEFLRCQDAFDDFASSGEFMINQEQLEANGQATVTTDQRRRVAFKTYNAYARFIHHLYEFIMGAVMRDRQDTKTLVSQLADSYLASELQRALTRRRSAILNGTAPAWENHISYFPEKIPPDLARDFRRFRNIAIGHVKIERSSLSLSDFYDRNHKYLHMLYRDVQSFWGRPSDEFPDLKEVTEFSVLIKATPPSRP